LNSISNVAQLLITSGVQGVHASTVVYKNGFQEAFLHNPEITVSGTQVFVTDIFHNNILRKN